MYDETSNVEIIFSGHGISCLGFLLGKILTHGGKSFKEYLQICRSVVFGDLTVFYHQTYKKDFLRFTLNSELFINYLKMPIR